MNHVVAPELLVAARETYDLTLLLGEDADTALQAALAAGIRASEQKMLSTIADEADTCARELAAEVLDEDDEGTPEFSVALSWFADRLRKKLEVDPSGKYEPQNGDVVEVTLVGEVGATGTREGAVAAWSVLDDYTGMAFSFPGHDGIEPRVRVISRAGERTIVEE